MTTDTKKKVLAAFLAITMPLWAGPFLFGLFLYLFFEKIYTGICEMLGVES